jgi:hypothetical protein
MEDAIKITRKPKIETRNRDIIKFKLEYKSFQEKYKLPSFEYLNENFEIENLASDETELFLKRIRKQITEKIYYHLRTLEAFMNPQNAPMFIFNIIKSFTSFEQELIKKAYDKLAGFEVDFFELEISYNEKKEADFIKKVCNEWLEINEILLKIHSSMKTGYNKEASKKTSKSYVG